MTVTIFVPDLEEFLPIVEAARKLDLDVRDPAQGYWRIGGTEEIRFVRKQTGLGPALWNSALIGGIDGEIVRFDKDEMILRARA